MRAEWPRERLDQLRDLFEAGLSHLLIAGRMGVGKGVISAKIARLGWRRGATAEAMVPIRTAAPLVVEVAKARRLEQLGEEDCHWPVSEDGWGVQLFCGCARAAKGPYCEGHRARSVRRPRAWERRAMAPRAVETPREGLGWDRFKVSDRPRQETW